jgi:hypothetical protein
MKVEFNGDGQECPFHMGVSLPDGRDPSAVAGGGPEDQGPGGEGSQSKSGVGH